MVDIALLQGLVGGSKPFEAFLKAYLQHFKFKTLTTTDFKDYFCNYFKDTQAIQQIDWQTWLYSPGVSLTFFMCQPCSAVDLLDKQALSLRLNLEA